jgi:hypothetical protein
LGKRHRAYNQLRYAIHMIRLLAIALSAATLLMGINASACQKHNKGHQNSSDANLQGSKK